MHKQYYTLCCNNNWCKQDSAQWKNFVGCKNYTKDSRNRTCITGPPKGFVQNLKDKLVNLQNESLQLQFSKKPVKKKQKDYYCLMLRKINNLDKKLQNLEHLFISHLNHTPSEVFNSNDNEPLYGYMDFYESVRSLVDLANRLKEDILYKQCDNHMHSRNTLHLNDRIQVLDSELQNLYKYLEQLQNCSGEIKGGKQCYVQDCQDVPFGYSAFRGGPKTENKRCSDFKEFRKINKNKKKTPEMYNEDCRNNSSSHCIECCYEADEDSQISCQCSRCNLNATICSVSPGNRRCSTKIFECRQGGSVAKNSDCSCVICVNEIKKANKFRKNCLWESQSISSCSCEICISNNRKSCSQNCNSARIKIIKPVKKGENEEDFFGELQILYHEMEPSKTDKKKKQKIKRRNQKINEDDQDSNLETTYFQDIGLEYKKPNSMTASHIKSRDGSILEQTQGKFTKSQYSKTFSPSNNQETEVENVVYYELTPDLNIITKRKNNGHVFNIAQEHYQGINKNAKKNKNKVANNKDQIKRNGPNRLHTVNFNVREENPSNKSFKKVVRDKRNSRDYRVNDQSSSENEHMRNFYRADKKIHTEQKNINKINGSAGKHLHIKIRKKKEFEEGMTSEENVIRSPERQYKYTNNRSQLYHRKHGGFCHFQNGKNDKEPSSSKRYPNIHPYNGEISESDSFETVEEYESDSDSCSSQYKVFFCNDPNCVEKLDSDELIMLMNKTDLKYCGGNPYKLNISENIRDLKSDVCEKCTIKEKTISVTPHKTKNRNNNGKAKIILKKEVVECSKCKNKKNDKLSEIIKTNIEYIDSETENDRNELREITNNSSNISNRGSNIKSSNQEGENKNKKGIKNQKSSQLLIEKDYHSQSTTITNVSNNRKQTNNIFGSNNMKTTTVVACSNLDKNTSFKILKADKSNSTKALEIPGFGNLININIERGSYSLNQQPDIISTQKGIEGANLPEIKSVGNKNMNSSPIADIKHDKIIGVNNVYSSNIQNVASISRNISNQLKTQSSHQADNKSSNNNSISAIDLPISSGKEIKEITIEKLEVFTKAVSNDNYTSKIKDDMEKQCNNDKIILCAATVTSGMTDEKDGKRQSKNNHVSVKKDMSLNYVTEENSGDVLHETQDSHYIYEKRYDPLSNTLSVSKNNVVKPKISTSRVKRSRLKYNKKFGSSLSKVSSAHSIVVQQAKLYPGDDFPSKKSNVFNPGRRVSKLSKRRHNGYSRMYSLKENSLSGIVKPQMKIVVQESCQNDLKIPSNNCSNSRYKVASISNYLSSTVVSESSYSTLNWEKIANKLKEDDKYFNNIAD